MGRSGIQSDIRTIQDMGGSPVTAITSVTVQNNFGISDIHNLPAELVGGQIKSVYEEEKPSAIKVGMINDSKTIRRIKEEIESCPIIVCSPVILSSHGGCMMSNEAIHAFCTNLLPICTMLIIKCTDAEIILGRRITTDQDMLAAAHSLRSMGVKWVLLRGGVYMEDRINALLIGDGYQSFFSSVNKVGWQRHGVGGTLTAAIATKLALGEDVPTAVASAHTYLHNQVVYASENVSNLRPTDIYNSFLSLVADHYNHEHGVAYYASCLNITSRYLSQITGNIGDRSPKQIIDNYLLHEAERLLSVTTDSIQEISNALGYSSQVAFAKFFHAKKGISPTTFRQKLGL